MTVTLEQVDNYESFFCFPVDGAIAQVFVFSYLSYLHEGGWGVTWLWFCGQGVVAWVLGVGSGVVVASAVSGAWLSEHHHHDQGKGRLGW